MKKLTVILLLAMLILSILPTVCFATTSTAAVGVEDVYLINPVSVAMYQDTMFVADKITSEQSLLHAFDLSDKPALVYTKEFTKQISKIKVDGDNLFVIFADSFEQYTITATDLEQVATHSVSNVADVTMRGENILVFLKNGTFTDIDNKNLGGPSVTGNGVAATRVDGTFYWLYSNETTSFYVTANWEDSVGFSYSQPQEFPSKRQGMAVTNAGVVFFSKTAVDNTNVETDAENTFVDVAGNGTDKIVAIVNKSIYIYNWNESSFVKSDYTIGSDTVKLTAPAYDKITSYTLVKPLGYPANIVYKTTDQTTSVEHIIDDASDLTYIVLGYDGCQNDEYYYVFVGDKFGWVKKSATTVDSDSKMQVIDTSVSNTIAGYYGKLMSANATFVYKLPSTAANMTKFELATLTQSVDDPITVKVLQSFVASDNTPWYFVEFVNQDIQYGFVLQGAVGNLTVRQGSQQITLEKDQPHMKINASLSEGVSIYVSKDMLETNLLTDANGKVVKLETNTKVGVIARLEKVSYVQVVYPNGTVYYGWVENHHLIALNAMTTNTVVGISFIFVATMLIVTTAAIVRKRQLKKQNPIIVDEE